MSDLVVDTTALSDLGTDLARVATEFSEANVHSDTIADAVGHERLADKVRSFAHGWDDTREDMVEQITFLSEAATAIADTLIETDGQLACSLEDAGDGSLTPTPAPSGTPGSRTAR